MGYVLVDSSVWISFFRGHSSVFTDQLNDLLREDAVCITPIVRAELLSGARTEHEWVLLEQNLAAVEMLVEKPGFWDRIARYRFLLARKGVQSSMTDLSIAAMAEDHDRPLLTIDKEFRAISKVVSFKSALI